MRLRLTIITVLALAITLNPGCACLRGAINGSESARWFLFSQFGASKICPEMQKRGMPIKIGMIGGNSVGRFFPQACNVQVNDQRRVMQLTFNGEGYATLPLTKRVGFYSAMTVEYKPDFRMEEDALYVWGTLASMPPPPELRILGVENPAVSLAFRTPAGDVATLLGQGIVASEIGRGFTAVRQDDGDDFVLGHLEPPAKPKRPFATGEDRYVLASDTTDIRGGSRDYLGPFEITKSTSLSFKFRLSGGSLSYALVDRGVGESWRRSYQSAQPLSPAPGPLMASGGISPGEQSQSFRVNPGWYYLVVENQSPTSFLPIPLSFGESVATLAYLAEIGD